MQKNTKKKLILIESTSNYSEEAGLDMISKIIDSTPNITDYVMQDLNRREVYKPDTGGLSMSAGQIVRTCVIKHLYGFTFYEIT